LGKKWRAKNLEVKGFLGDGVMEPLMNTDRTLIERSPQKM
jgi:hypothetical protein